MAFRLETAESRNLLKQLTPAARISHDAMDWGKR
jgi:hypothetical protein